MPSTPVQRRRRKAEAGFSLIELLVVLAILGLLIGIVAPPVIRYFDGSLHTGTHITIYMGLGAGA